jgi:hypothetical protein
MRAPILETNSDISAAQLAANRLNAQHSTGPRTPEGKARVAQNAIKHGLFSREHWVGAALIGEDAGEFDVLLGEMLEDCDPQDRCERDLVHRIAALTWRLARVHRAMEATLVDIRTVTEEEAADGMRSGSACDAIRESESLSPLETHLSRELSRLQRDLAFSQRYRHAAAERAEERAAKRATPPRRESLYDPQRLMAELALEEAQVEQMLQRSSARLAAQYDDDREDDEDEDEELDEIEAGSHHKPNTFQRLSRKLAKQTQSQGVREASRRDDGSIDLT